MATAAERTPPAAKARARARVHPSRRKDTGMAYIMLAPVLVLLGIFVIWPAIQAVYLSFFDWSFYTDSEFVGWKNFRNVLIDDNFWDAIVRGLRRPRTIASQKLSSISTLRKFFQPTNSESV